MVSIDIHMLPKEIPDLFAITQSLAMSGISLLVCYGSPSCESRGLESNTWLITHHDQLTISRHTGRSTYPRHGFCSTPPIPGSTRAHKIQMSLTRLFQQVALFGGELAHPTPVQYIWHRRAHRSGAQRFQARRAPDRFTYQNAKRPRRRVQ